jgi:hypothetical protein
MTKGQRTSLRYFDGPNGRIRDLDVITRRDGRDLLFPYPNDSDPQKKQLHHDLFLDDKRKACGLVYVTQDEQGKWRREFWYDNGWGWKRDGDGFSESYDSIKELYDAIEANRDRRTVRNFATYLASRISLSSDEIIAELSEKYESSSDSCFIATAAYSTSRHPDLTTFRQFRDRQLLSNGFGRQLVRLYYKISPSIANHISQKPTIKIFLRHQLEHLARWMRTREITKP